MIPKCNLLNEDQVKTIAKSLKDVETAFAVAVTRLYLSRPGDNRFQYTKHMGALLFIKNRAEDTYYFRIHSLRLPNFSMIFNCEIPYDMSLTTDSDCSFAQFQHKEVSVGFSFATSKTSTDTHPSLTSPTSMTDGGRFCAKVKQMLAEHNYKPEANTPTAERGRKESIFKKFSNMMFGGGSNNAPVAKEIGPVTGMKHVGHVGADGVVDIQSDDPNLKKFLSVLKEAGVSKSDLKNPEIMSMVKQTFEEYGQTENANLVGSIATSSDRGASTGAATAKSSRPKVYLKALYKFEANGEEQISLSKGEIVRQVKKFDNGWVKVERTDASKERGFVPSDYCEVATDYHSKRATPTNSDTAHISTQTDAASKSSRSPKAPKKRIEEEPNKENAGFFPPSKTANSAPGAAAAAAAARQKEEERETALPTTAASSSGAAEAPGAPAKRAPPPRPKSTISGAPPATSAQEPPQEVQSTSRPGTEEEGSSAPAQSARPPHPFAGQNRNALLAGIQGFKKEELNKADSAEESAGGDKPSARPPHPLAGGGGGRNPLLAGIEGFKKENLAKTSSADGENGESGSKPSKPPGPVNMLSAIKGFDKSNLKKAEERPIPEKPATEPSKGGAAPGATGGGGDAGVSIAAALKMKLEKVRMNTKHDSDSEESEGDWE